MFRPDAAPAALPVQPVEAAGPLNALVVGGGIGGLAAALACARRGWTVQVHEQAERFTEVGAGVQLGPNVTRRLAAWGLADALAQASVQPGQLVVRSAVHGGVLAARPLRGDMPARYGAPYATVHRASLHQVLLGAVRAQGDIDVMVDSRVREVREDGEQLVVQRLAGTSASPGRDATPVGLLIAADGVWSRTRGAVIDGDTLAEPTGHMAYRALTLQEALPRSLRSMDVTVWLGPRLHAVRYPVIDPVRGGIALNWVLVLHRDDLPTLPSLGADASRWDHAAQPREWAGALAAAHASLRDALDAMPAWQRWALYDRAPLTSAAQMARGRIALLGDAAHPMRPYLAQGAGMAIEDAFALEYCLGLPGLSVAQQLQRYAQARWQRNAQVQQRSRRNGSVFHATGLVRWGRDAALRAMGERLLDQPWLYGG